MDTKNTGKNTGYEVNLLSSHAGLSTFNPSHMCVRVGGRVLFQNFSFFYCKKGLINWKGYFVD